MRASYTDGLSRSWPYVTLGLSNEKHTSAVGKMDRNESIGLIGKGVAWQTQMTAKRIRQKHFTVMEVGAVDGKYIE